jgi:hypothetical protein
MKNRSKARTVAHSEHEPQTANCKLQTANASLLEPGLHADADFFLELFNLFRFTVA